MFIKKYGDIIVGAVFTLIGLALIAASRALPKSQVMDIGPDFMPTLIGVIITGLAVFLLYKSIKNFRANSAAIDPSEKDESDYKRVALSLIASLFYVFMLKPVGFIISTLIYIFGQIYILAPDANRTRKDLITYLIIDVIFTFIVYYLFRLGFKIILPSGILTFM